MKTLLLIMWLLAPQEASYPASVHGGQYACYEQDAWIILDRLQAAEELREFNIELEKYRESGVCWLSRAGQQVEIAGSDLPGTVRVRLIVRETTQTKMPPERWAYISTGAIRDG